MTGPADEYLSQLRASLRARPAETSRILAEAEDHLRESAAAGLRAGMTEAEAQEAAISAFGPVRVVARAHQTRRARAAAVLGGCAMTSWKLAGLLLLASGTCDLVLLAEIRLTMNGARLAPGAGAAPLAGLVPRGIAVGTAWPAPPRGLPPGAPLPTARGGRGPGGYSRVLPAGSGHLLQRLHASADPAGNQPASILAGCPSSQPWRWLPATGSGCGGRRHPGQGTRGRTA